MRPILAVLAVTLAAHAAQADGTFDNRLRGPVPEIDRRAPLSSVVAVGAVDGGPLTDAARKAGELSPGVADGVRVADGLTGGLLVSWLQPVGPAGERFGANNDYLAWFGDAAKGYLWVSHEYLSGQGPTGRAAEWTAPTGDHARLAQWLMERGKLACDGAPPCWSQPKARAAHVAGVKESLGGSWLRVVKGGDGWRVDPTDANARRYPASSTTRLLMTGPYAGQVKDHDDAGRPLPKGVVAGTIADCSGGVTPWGTVLLGEENVEAFYGKKGRGLDIAGKGPSHDPDYYGWAAEIDPGADPGLVYDPKSGKGHAKHSALGRARWENFSFAVGADGRPVEGGPLTVYFADDRSGGRVHKFVSAKPWRQGASRAEKRKLLTAGTLFVSALTGVAPDGHTMTATGRAPTRGEGFVGRWVPVAVDHLADLFANEERLGIFGQNRPEEVEWHPGRAALYIAYTGHDDRGDRAGRIWAFEERPGESFIFYEVAAGSERLFADGGFARPDNLVVGTDGSLWFATDGQPGVTGGVAADAFYLLEIDDATGAARAVKRIVTAPPGAEITGPAFTPDMTTLFLAIQHPGEGAFEAATGWPLRP
ncbi:MAG: DUF839 domain-containing protein [Nitrospinae bacterium]|nr:DUF839 domain-containing protein [Nitrospinota bacterium]